MVTQSLLTVQAQNDKPETAPVTDNLTDYSVEVHTANMPDAGTDADVFLVMCGDQGEYCC